MKINLGKKTVEQFLSVFKTEMTQPHGCHEMLIPCIGATCRVFRNTLEFSFAQPSPSKRIIKADVLACVTHAGMIIGVLCTGISFGY